MSVYLRGKSYHYRFLFKGKDYSGVCSGCSTEGRAKEYERSIREKIRREAETLSAEEDKIRQNKTIRALVDNYSYVLTGGSQLPLRRLIRLHCKSRAAANRRSISPDRNFATGTTLSHTWRQSSRKSRNLRKYGKIIAKLTSAT